MNFIQKLTEQFDTYQQNHKVLAFPVAVVKRYGDDEAGKLAALITYYAFLAIFPLLLVFLTVVGIIAQNNPELETKIISQVLEYFPALGNNLKESVSTVKGAGIILALQLLVLLYGARGLATILRQSFDKVWHVEPSKKANFFKESLRSIVMMTAVGLGIIGGAVISYSLASVFDFGFIGVFLLTLLNIFLTLGLFLIVFRLGTSRTVGLKGLLMGAGIAAIGTVLVQHFGGYIMSYQLPKLQSSYGSFAFALAMLFWIYFQAQFIMFALEATAVKVQRDWPKSISDED